MFSRLVLVENVCKLVTLLLMSSSVAFIESCLTSSYQNLMLMPEYAGNIKCEPYCIISSINLSNSGYIRLHIALYHGRLTNYFATNVATLCF